MRRIQKIKIIDLIDSLHEVNVELLNLYKDNVQEAVSLLSQCQQSAIVIGDLLEQDSDDHSRIVNKLEQYCENIYLLSEKIEAGSSDINEDIKKLDKELELIKADINNFVAGKYEVVFMPYKMEMWDCMKSVWEAACEDERCEPHVVPLPYCTRKPDKTLGEFIVELEQFRNSGVEAEDFREYNLKEHTPDICFIHNPFDDHNFVTSVHPEYYSYNLKKYVKTLVYIPYFFTGARIPDIHLSDPSYKNMDYIVLPGQLSVEQMSPYVPKEKLLPLGSPKVDEAVKADKKAIPAEWKKIIGSKKVVLYNLGVGSLLDGGNRTLEKMRYIFNVFKRREDVAMIWRPHPLIKSTLLSMNPQLYYSYLELEKEFQLEHIGIYDVTPDTSYSVSAADAFLGDYSSLVHIFGVTGKPVFYTNNTSTVSPDLSDRIFHPAEIILKNYQPDNSSFYFMSHDYNVFGTFDEQGQIDIIGQVGDTFTGYSQYNYCPDPENEEIYFLPIGNGDSIIITDMGGNEKKRIKIENPAANNNFMWMYKWNDLRIFVPGDRCAIGRYNVKTNSFEYDDRFNKELQSFKRYDSEMLFRWMIQIGRKLYGLCYRAGAIMEYDIETTDYRFHLIGDEKDIFSNFSYDGKGKFYLVEWGGKKVVSWDVNTHKERTYDSFPENFRPCDSIYRNEFTPAFQLPLAMGDYLYVFPFLANMILKINLKTGEAKEVDFGIPYIQGQRKSSLYGEPSNFGAIVKIDENKILLKSSFDDSVIIVNVSDCSHHRFHLKRPEDWESKVNTDRRRWLTRNNIDPLYYYNENGFNNTIDDFLEMLTKDEWESDIQYESYRKSRDIEHLDGECGKAVLNTIIEREYGR